MGEWDRAAPARAVADWVAGRERGGDGRAGGGGASEVAADACAAAGREGGRGDRGRLSRPHHARLATGAPAGKRHAQASRGGGGGGTSGDRRGGPAVPSMVAAAVAVPDAAVGRACGGGGLHAVVIPKKQQRVTLRKRTTAMMQPRSVREQTIERGGTDATPARWPPLHPCTPASGRRSPRPTSASMRPPSPTHNPMRPPLYRQHNRRRLEKVVVPAQPRGFHP